MPTFLASAWSFIQKQRNSNQFPFYIQNLPFLSIRKSPIYIETYLYLNSIRINSIIPKINLICFQYIEAADNNLKQMEVQKNTRIFNPIKYFNQYYSRPDGHEQQNMGKVFFKFMHEIFEKLPQCSFGIEIGCGPVLTPAAFSSRKINHLLLTDYNPQCFKLISKWIQEDNQDPWKDHFQIIKQLQKTQQDIKKRLKRVLLGCAKVDLTNEMIFELPLFRKADIIISSLCFLSRGTGSSSFQQNNSQYKTIFGCERLRVYDWRSWANFFYGVKSKVPLPIYFQGNSTSNFRIKWILNCYLQIIKFQDSSTIYIKFQGSLLYSCKVKMLLIINSKLNSKKYLNIGNLYTIYCQPI